MTDRMEEKQSLTIPTLALRGLTIFPNMLLHFDVGRVSSIKALDEAMIARNLTCGGCADLLACLYFLYATASSEQWQENLP